MTAPRNTPERVGIGQRHYPLAASTTVYAGRIAVLDGAHCKPGSTALGRVAVGVFTRTAANLGSAGAMSAQVQRGVFRFENSTATDEVTLAEVGKKCWIVNDETVAKTDGAVDADPATRSVAGIVDDVDEQGVWVRIDPSYGIIA